MLTEFEFDFCFDKSFLLSFLILINLISFPFLFSMLKFTSLSFIISGLHMNNSKISAINILLIFLSFLFPYFSRRSFAVLKKSLLFSTPIFLHKCSVHHNLF